MSKADDAISIAQGEIGKPYSYGAEGPSAFDCSGLIQWVYAHVGIKLPRTAAAQQDATTPVTGDPRPGDLVFWGNPATHVGLYVGGGQMIAAPHTGAKVQMQAVYGSPSGYGRVTGAGVAASIAGAATAANAALFSDGGFTDAITGGIRDTAIRVSFALLGLGLVGFGLYRGFGSAIKNDARKALN